MGLLSVGGRRGVGREIVIGLALGTGRFNSGSQLVARSTRMTCGGGWIGVAGANTLGAGATVGGGDADATGGGATIGVGVTMNQRSMWMI